MHVLIGPDDAGKTSILEAITALCRSVDYPLAQAFPGSWQGSDLVWQHTPRLPVSLGVVIAEEQLQCEYQLSYIFTSNERTVSITSEHFQRGKESHTVDLF
jgi:predicted ATP-dependent endonuclease of OLD family